MSDQLPPIKDKPVTAAHETQVTRRSERHGAKAVKSAKREEALGGVRQALGRFGRNVKGLGYYMLVTAGALVALLIVLLLIANAVNYVARWNAQRLADKASSPSGVAERAKENVLVIGADAQGKATGFLAMRVDRKGGQVFGVAIPDGAFIEVPGQGFERIGASYKVGPEVSMAAVANYLGVPLRNWMVVPAAAYKQALTEQSVAALPGSASESNLSVEERTELSAILADIDQENVALVPLPVKPIKLGDQTYFEPQRQEIADLLESWWGVKPGEAEKVTRVIVYNGAGSPGIAGQAAQQLIRAGYRVVDTKNADSFNYKETVVVVKRGTRDLGRKVADELGVGAVSVEPTDADVTDIIVIIGKDYKPPATTGTGGKQ